MTSNDQATLLATQHETSQSSLTKALWVVVILLITTNMLAQVSRTGGTLAGMVTDSTGAAIVGASIDVRDVNTGYVRTAVSDATGQFRAAEVPTGSYQVTIRHAGFAPFVSQLLTVELGQTLHITAEMRPQSVQGQVTVSASASGIDTSASTVTTNIGGEQIEELPVVTRNYLNFVLLAPGVANAPSQAPASGSTGLAGAGFTFGGLRTRSNNVSIDGLDNNDEYTGSSRTELSPEIVSEFQVINNGISAESGGASGGAINVVTRSGTNVLHGDAFIFEQNGDLNARVPFTNEARKPALSRQRLGLSLGGPMVKDRAFYYAAFEQERARGEAEENIAPMVVRDVNAVLAGGAYPRMTTRALTTTSFPANRAETELAGKFNQQITRDASLALRYSFTNNREAGNAFNDGNYYDRTARGSSFTVDHGLAASLTWLIGPSSVNDLRGQIATRRAELRTQADRTGPEVDIAGQAVFGRSYDGNSWRRENHYEVSDVVAVTRGTHYFKAGGTVNRVSLGAHIADGFGGAYIFADVPSFASAAPQEARQVFGSIPTQFGVTAIGGFVQDHWTPRQSLNIDLGLRYDMERIPAQFNQDTDNFSPRIGIAYSPSARWVIRAGYGVFFDRYLLVLLNRAIQLNGTNTLEQVLFESSAATALNFSAGGPIPAPQAVMPSIYRLQPNAQTPYSQQVTISVERDLGSGVTASATYQFVRGVKLPRTANVNLLPPEALTPANAGALGFTTLYPQELGRLVFGPGRVDPAFDGIYELQDESSSNYHGLSLTASRKFTEEITFTAAYTFSKAIDDASEFFEQPQNLYNLRGERAVSLNDLRHRFVFSGLFELPFGEEQAERKASAGEGITGKVLAHIELAPIVTIQSGRPVNPIVGIDAEHNLAWPLSSRPLGMARNSLRMPAQASVDFRVVKYFPVQPHARLDLVAESFNLFNRANVDAINPVFGTGAVQAPTFAQPIRGLPGRQLQFSIDFEF